MEDTTMWALTYHGVVLSAQLVPNVADLLQDVVPEAFKLLIDGANARLGEIKPYDGFAIIRGQ